MGRQKGEGARSKARPSSSSLAASFLPSDTTAVGFGGFVGGSRLDSSISSEEASPFLDIDGEVAQHLKRLARKDPTTKLKALSSLFTLLKQKSAKEIAPIIPQWGFSPHLKSLMGPWCVSQFAPVYEVSQAAKRSLQAAFPAQEKRLDALILCATNIFMYLEENLMLTPQSLSDKAAPLDEVEEMHQQERGPILRSMWRGISRVWPKLAPHIGWKVGNGNIVDFWEDIWCGEVSLKSAFPNLFNIASVQIGCISRFLSPMGNAKVWDIHFRRPFHDWEIHMVANFFERIQGSIPSSDDDDSMYWSGGGSDSFSVKALFNCLQEPIARNFPWKLIWKVKVPPKASFFSWEAVRGVILTGDNLKRRGMTVVNRCFLCKEDEESPHHLLIHCKISREVWNIIFSCFGISWCMPFSVADLMFSWELYRSKNCHFPWDLTPACVLWCIWRERNSRAYEGVETPLHKFFCSIFRTLFFWSSGNFCNDYVSFVDGLSTLSLY